MSALITGIHDELILAVIDPRWFWSRVVVDDSYYTCWPWRGGRNDKDYGVLRIPGTTITAAAHRVALLLERGQPLGPLRALHHCDNPPCCNPYCLWAGTAADNTQDSVAKGRWNTPENTSQRVMSSVESMIKRLNDPRIKPAAKCTPKLTEKDVSDIRQRRAAGELTSTLAREFKVNPSYIRHIVAGTRKSIRS